MHSFVADALSKGLFISPIIPKDNGMSDIAASIWKLMMEGNKLVKGIMRKDKVTSNPEMAINLKPNPRPHDTIQVFLPPFLSPSMSGISTLPVNNICKNSMGMTKMKKGRFKVPIKLK